MKLKIYKHLKSLFFHWYPLIIPTNKTDTNIDKIRYETRRTDKQNDIRIDSQITEMRIGTHKPTRTKRHTNERLVGYKNHSSMTEKIMDQQLWNLYSIASDNDRKFIDAKSLDEIAGNELANKYRTVKRLVSEMVDGIAL